MRKKERCNCDSSCGENRYHDKGEPGCKHHKEVILKLWDLVSKIGGDYSYDGWVVGIIEKRGGHMRYVVEDERGLLFIFNRNNLAFMARAPKARKKP